MEYNRIVIKGRLFKLDEVHNQLFDVAEPSKSIFFSSIENSAGDLEFFYNHRNGEYSTLFQPAGFDAVSIPLKDLKTGIKELFAWATYDNGRGFILLDEAYDRRLDGELPLLELYDDNFKVDAQHLVIINTHSDQLLSLEHAEMVDRPGEAYYHGYYHIKDKDLIAIDRNVTELPENTVYVKFPLMRSLDPIGVSLLDEEPPYSYIYKYPLRNYAAEIIPLERSPIMKQIEANKLSNDRRIKFNQLRKGRNRKWNI